MSQISLFDGTSPLKITKPIRLIECFAGYGSQALSLKYLGVNFDHWKIAEWAVKSIQAYKDMHFPHDNTDYSKEHSKEWLIDYLYDKGISADYNNPMKKEQIARMGEDKIRTVYNNIIATHNLVSVTNVSGKDLEITDTDQFTYLLTYSFPCQDLSSAGLLKGMSKGSGTRSGLLWEIERILDECEELPQVLIMENVPEVIGSKNAKSFSDWFMKLESLGYKSYYKVMNAKDYEMPQNRDRCFMVSALGDHYYEFPDPKPLKLRLKDLLEKNVPQNYYLSDSILQYFIRHTKESEEKGNGFRFTPTDGDCIAKCVTTRAGGRMDDNFIDDKVHSVVKLPHGYFPGSIERNAETSPTIDTGVGNWHTLIGEETYYGVGLNESEEFRKAPMRECARTLLANKANCGEGVLISQCDCVGHIEKPGFNEMTGRVYGTDSIAPTVRTFCGGGQEVKIMEALALDEQNQYIRKDGTVGTLTTDGSSPKHNNRVIEFEPRLVGGFGDKKSNAGTQWYQQDRVYGTDTVAMCHCASIPQGSYNYLDNARVRKLTPKECFRLMGVKDEDFERVAKNQSNSSLYHLAGDSIVTNCLMEIFKQMI